MPSRIVLDSVVLKVVLDTNVVVSALLKRDGRESQVLRLGLDRKSVV